MISVCALRGAEAGMVGEFLERELTELSTTIAIEADQVRVLLEDTFSVRFRIWQWSSGWRDALHSAPGSVTEDSPPPDLQVLLEDARSGPQVPHLADGGDAAQVLLIPFKSQGEILYATAAADTDSPHVWLQLARAVLERRGEARELKRLQRENREYAVQLSNDLEELVFLRCIADHLEFRGSSRGTSSLSELVLPQLREAVFAEALGLMVEGKHVSKAPMTWSGRRVLPDDDCRKLVERYRQQALQQPLVVNNVPRKQDAPDGDTVRGLILVPVNTAGHIHGWLIALNRQKDEDVPGGAPWRLSHHEFGSAEATLLQSAASVIAAHTTTSDLFREKERLLVNVVRAIVSAVETRDEYTCGHSERVALFGERLCREMGYDDEACERIYLTCLLHDVGKIGIRDATLNKPGRLTEEEFEEIKRHPDLGWSILQDLEQLGHLFPGIVHHHEHYDGAGYPDGLAGKEIPLDARIVAVVDAYDAMTSDRPYRNGISREKTAAILREGKGRQWDPDVVDAFLRIMPEIVRLGENYRRPARSRRPATRPADTRLQTSREMNCQPRSSR